MNKKKVFPINKKIKIRNKKQFYRWYKLIIRSSSKKKKKKEEKKLIKIVLILPIEIHSTMSRPIECNVSIIFGQVNQKCLTA